MAAIKEKTLFYTFAGGVISLETIFGWAGKVVWVRSVTIRAHASNSGLITWNAVGDTPGGYLQAGEAVTKDYGEGQTLLSELQISGATNDRAYLTLCLDRTLFDQGVVK